MKRFILGIIIHLLLYGTFSFAADTLYIHACDEAAVNIFDELLCLSKETATLRTYVGDKIKDIYNHDEKSSLPLLQEPGQPVFDGADRIYLLDKANRYIYSWDRFLNIHSITKLHDDIISPVSFTVNSEHDWLIYDDFYGQIIQVHPGEIFYSGWGDEPVSGELELFAMGEYVIVHLIDQSKVRVTDANGTTLSVYSLPGSINIKKVFPFQDRSFALSAPSGVYIWKPHDDSLRYLSDMKNLIHCSMTKTGYRLISQEGMIVTLP